MPSGTTCEDSPKESPGERLMRLGGKESESNRSPIDFDKDETFLDDNDDDVEGLERVVEWLEQNIGKDVSTQTAQSGGRRSSIDKSGDHLTHLCTCKDFLISNVDAKYKNSNPSPHPA